MTAEKQSFAFQVGDTGDVFQGTALALDSTADRLLFWSEHHELRAFSPAPANWRALGAEELVQLLRVAVPVSE